MLGRSRIRGNQGKKLSVNNVDFCRDFPKGDDGSSQTVERHKAAFGFFVTNQQLAKSIEPAMAFDHPAPIFLLGMAV
jgi:hypothetical protein